MPDVIETTVYRLDELSEAAKDNARAWYREGGFDYDWYDAVYEDFRRIADILGIRIKSRTVRLMGGGVRQEPCIWFTGFWSQGDGAAFEGHYSYRKGTAAEIRTYAPKDVELHRIADALHQAQRRNFYQLTAEATHWGAILSRILHGDLGHPRQPDLAGHDRRCRGDRHGGIARSRPLALSPA